MKPIDPRVHQALDREIAREGLPPELALQVARLEAAAAVLGTAVSRWAGEEGSVEARVMAAIRRPAPSRMWRLARWLAAPHSVTLRIRPPQPARGSTPAESAASGSRRGSPSSSPASRARTPFTWRDRSTTGARGQFRSGMLITTGCGARPSSCRRAPTNTCSWWMASAGCRTTWRIGRWKTTSVGRTPS